MQAAPHGHGATALVRHRRGGHCGRGRFEVEALKGIAFNVRRLDAASIVAFEVVPFDDGERAASTAAIAHLGRDGEP